MTTEKLQRAFLLGVLLAAIHFAVSGDAAIVSATREVKFRLTVREKVVESTAVGLGATLPILLMSRISQRWRKRHGPRAVNRNPEFPNTHK